MEGRSYGDDANDEDESNERTYYTSDLVICEINRPELLRSRHKREDKQARIPPVSNKLGERGVGKYCNQIKVIQRTVERNIYNYVNALNGEE